MKIHYTKELIDKCIPIFKQGIKYIFSYSKKNTPLKKHLLKTFQENLEKIPKWNSMIVMKEFDRFKINSNCSWLDKLIKASFLAEFKLASNNNDIKVDIPKSQDFIHLCYIELAREIWIKPQIMFDGFTNELRKVYETELDVIIETTIMKVIKNLLPLEKLVNNYLKSVDEDEYNSDDDEKNSIRYDESQINNSDYDSSDYEDSEDETDNSEQMKHTHSFNEDVMINKIGGDENNSQKTANTIDNTNHIITNIITNKDEKDEEEDNREDENKDEDEDNHEYENEDEEDENENEDEEDENENEDEEDENENENENEKDENENKDVYNVNDVHVNLSIEEPLVPVNTPVIHDTNEPDENTTVHLKKNSPDETEMLVKQPMNIINEEALYVPNEDIIINKPYDEENNNENHVINEPTTTKIVKIGNDEMKVNNNNKIKNILGIDMNYNDFIRKKDRLRKSLLSKATA